MMEPKPVRPETLEALTDRLKNDYRNLITTYNTAWRAADREPARQTLLKSVSEASAAVRSVEGTQDPEVRRLHDALLIQMTLSEDACKHPSTLKR